MAGRITKQHQYRFLPSPDGVDHQHVARVIIARHDLGLPVYPNHTLREFAERELKRRITFNIMKNE